MTLKQLMYFEVLSRTQHYQQAADRLDVSQPVLSRAIAGLEEELGVPLFEKQGRNVVLSRYGRTFAEHVTNGLQEIEAGVESVKLMNDPKFGVIDLSVNFIMANLFLPEVLQTYRQLDHKTEPLFRFHQSNTPQILQELRDGISEIGLCSYMSGAEGIEFTPIARYPLRFLTKTTGILARKKSVTLEEIAALPLIFSTDRTHYIENLLIKKGLDIHVACRMGEDRSIANLVAAGIGSTLLPYDPQLQIPGTVWIPIEEEEAYREFYLATYRGRSLSTHAQAFIKFLTEQGQVQNR